MEIKVFGNVMDDHTRCSHYHSELDIIALKLKCCAKYYACIFCHNENEDHKSTVWLKTEYNTKAILCGNCNTEMTIETYLNSNNNCIHCNSSFNPKCNNHYHYYFEL
jgi:uncharacterized CHY-type Zn-finger protein